MALSRSFSLLAALAALLMGCESSPETPEEWIEGSLPEIARGLADGDVTSEALVQAYLTRIEQIDRAGPRLQSIISLNPNALDEARELDRQRDAGEAEGRLHGVPILLKDNIESREPIPTTAGSFALIDNVSLEDAPLVAGLRREGALILGKTNLSEWANFRSQASMSGWSAVGGQVKNPHMLDRNPCGSSSGSGAAVAASLAAGAVGTETNGSVICPSTVNGVVGFKPTVGLVSQAQIVPIAFSQDTAGPMTKSVRGAAMMLAAMDDSDVDYEARLHADYLDGKRIGVARFSVGRDQSIWPLFDEAVRTLEELGAEIVEIEEELPRPDGYQGMGYQILLYEFKATINEYLANTPDGVDVRSLEDLIAFNAAHARELVLFDQSILEAARDVGSLEDEVYRSARSTLDEATRGAGIDRYRADHEVELLIAPSGIPSSRIDPINGDVWPPFVGIGSVAAIAGYPHATVPMGTVHTLPIGLSFIGTAGADADVLAAAYAYEQASQKRATPRFLTSAEELAEIRDGLDTPTR